MTRVSSAAVRSEIISGLTAGRTVVPADLTEPIPTSAAATRAGSAQAVADSVPAGPGPGSGRGIGGGGAARGGGRRSGAPRLRGTMNRIVKNVAMTTSNPFAGWFPGWGADRSGPLSGDVSQWFKVFSPTVTVNGRGEPELEARIVRDVATYGAQLGPLTQVVLSMAKGEAPPADELAKLVTINEAVQDEKRDYDRGVRDRARRALTDLRQQDPAGLAAVLDEFRTG